MEDRDKNSPSIKQKVRSKIDEYRWYEIYLFGLSKKE